MRKSPFTVVATREFVCNDVANWFSEQASSEQAWFLGYLLNYSKKGLSERAHGLQLSYLVEEVLKSQDFNGCEALIDFARDLANESRK